MYCDLVLSLHIYTLQLQFYITAMVFNLKKYLLMLRVLVVLCIMVVIW